MWQTRCESLNFSQVTSGCKLYDTPACLHVHVINDRISPLTLMFPVVCSGVCWIYWQRNARSDVRLLKIVCHIPLLLMVKITCDIYYRLSKIGNKIINIVVTYKFYVFYSLKICWKSKIHLHFRKFYFVTLEEFVMFL